MAKQVSISNFDFKEWIKDHQTEAYEIKIVNDYLIELVTDYAKATISFVVIEGNTIVEFRIVSDKDDAVKFYLHFELNDEKHAKQLYDEMVETLIGLKNEKTLKVLLSCSAGLTTAMFAENLNTMVDLTGIDYHFYAVPYLNIYEEVEKYDIVLIAPQIGYMYERLKNSLHDKLVLQIPTALFASYDAMATLNFIRKELEAFTLEKKTKGKEECYCCVEYQNRILSIALSINKAQTRIYYQLHDKCNIIENNMIIKSSFNIYDLYDIIETLLLKYEYIDVIGIATPGIVQDRKQLKIATDGSIVDIKHDFEAKYDIEVFVYNNANAAAVGFSLEHPEYKDIIFHSQPFGFGVGGQGIIYNGEVVRGRNGVAGEIRFFLRRMQLSDDTSKLAWTQQGAMELVTKALLPSISVFGLEAVALYSPMTPNMKEVKEVLKSFIPENYLPEFYYIKDPSSYMLNGITQLCVNHIENIKKEVKA